MKKHTNLVFLALSLIFVSILSVASQHSQNLNKQAALPPSSPPSLTQRTILSENFSQPESISHWNIISSSNSPNNQAIIESQSFKLQKDSGSIVASRNINQSPNNVLIQTKFYDDGDIHPNSPGFLVAIRDSQENLPGTFTFGLMALGESYYLRSFSYDSQDQKIPSQSDCFFQDDKIKIGDRSEGWHQIEFIVLDSGSYLKLDNNLITNPSTISSNWDEIITGKIDICKSPIKKLDQINLSVNWGQDNVLKKFYLDEFQIIKSEPRLTIASVTTNLIAWYLSLYSNINDLDPAYTKVFDYFKHLTQVNPMAAIRQHNASISIFRDITVRAHLCHQGQARFCQQVNQRLSNIFNYSFDQSEDQKPFSASNWTKLHQWRVLPLATEQLVLIDYLMAHQLSPDNKTAIYNRVKETARHFTDPVNGCNLLPYSCNGYPGPSFDFNRCQVAQNFDCTGNTSAEENAWFASSFSAIYNYLQKSNDSDQTLTSQLSNKNRCFAFHSLTNSTSDQYPGCPNVQTTTIFPYFHYDPNNLPTPEQSNSGQYNFVVNHDMIHPNYMTATIASLARGGYYYQILSGQDIPAEFKHNVDKIWSSLWNLKDSQICNFTNQCSKDNPQCCAFIDRDTFFYQRNFERFQGGLLVSGPSIVYFLNKQIGVTDHPSAQQLLSNKILFHYQTPAVYFDDYNHQDNQNKTKWLSAFDTNVTTLFNYIITVHMQLSDLNQR